MKSETVEDKVLRLLSQPGGQPRTIAQLAKALYYSEGSIRNVLHGLQEAGQVRNLGTLRKAQWYRT